MKSKLFLTVLLLAAITTIGISQDKQRITPQKGFGPPPVKPAKSADDLQAEIAEFNRIVNLSNDTRSLVGIKGINVYIGLGKDAKSAGLTEEQLKTDVELKLRLAGIKVNSIEDAVQLSVQIVARSYDAELSILHSAEIKLKQQVRLCRNIYTAIDSLSGYGQTVNATTWNNGTAGTCPTTEFPESVRKNVKDSMDEFINDYLTANPKK